jgi:regulator of sigma E protease
MTFIAIVVFVLMFSLLVLVHETGHYLAAKRAGVKVEEFGLGLPPRIWGKRHNGTIWSINLIPFGGFVRLKGEDGQHAHDKDSMVGKGYGDRLLIISAGVLMNFASAYVLLMIGFWLGMAPLAADLKAFDGGKFESKVVVIQVMKNSGAEKAGLKPGDIVLKVNQTSIALAKELQTAVGNHEIVTLQVERDKQPLTLKVGTKLDSGKRVMGVMVDEAVSKVSYVWWKVPGLALLDLVLLIKNIAVGLWMFVVHLFATASIQDSVAGPVGIAKVTSEAVKMGWSYTLQLIIFLSVNLGLINIVPFPALDGGRLAFVVLEIIRGGKKVGKEWENGIHSLGFLLLLALIFAVTYRDIMNLFHPV